MPTQASDTALALPDITKETRPPANIKRRLRSSEIGLVQGSVVHRPILRPAESGKLTLLNRLEITGICTTDSRCSDGPDGWNDDKGLYDRITGTEDARVHGRRKEDPERSLVRKQ